MFITFIEKTGHYKYREEYFDYITGKTREVSITLPKNNKKTQREAQLILQKKIQERLEPNNLQEITLHGLIEVYRKDLQKSVKNSTFRRNYYALQACEEMLGPSSIVSRITVLYLKERFLDSGKEGKTLNGYLKRFKRLISWAVENRILPEDVNGICSMPKFPDNSEKKKTEDKYLEPEQLDALISSMDDHPLFQQLSKFLALTGMRVGEAIALDKKDVDLQNGVIRINKTYDSNNYCINTAKTEASAAEIDIQDELVPVIHMINSLMMQQALMNRYKTDLFLSGPTGHYLTYNNYRYYLERKSEKVLGRAVTPHIFRHTHASLLFTAGFTVEEVSRRLRHSDSRITKEIYIHITKKLREKDREKLRNTRILCI